MLRWRAKMGERPAMAKGSRPCPVCQSVMSISRRGKTELDVCEEHGVWLDRGELEDVVRRSRIGEATRVHMAEKRAREGRVSDWWLATLELLYIHK